MFLIFFCETIVKLFCAKARGGENLNNEKKRPGPSEAQYRIMAMRFSELIYKDWFENGGKEKYEKEHPNWREEEKSRLSETSKKK